MASLAFLMDTIQGLANPAICLGKSGGAIAPPAPPVPTPMLSVTATLSQTELELLYRVILAYLARVVTLTTPTHVASIAKERLPYTNIWEMP